MLVANLPPESATARALGGTGVGWSQEMEILAGIYDRLGWQMWQAGGKSSAPHPKPFPRPGAARTSMSTEMMFARLIEQREREAQDARC